MNALTFIILTELYTYWSGRFPSIHCEVVFLAINFPTSFGKSREDKYFTLATPTELSPITLFVSHHGANNVNLTQVPVLLLSPDAFKKNELLENSTTRV